MRSFSRSHSSRFVAIAARTALAGLVAVGAMSAFQSGTAHAAAGTGYTATRSQIKIVGTVNLSALPTLTAAQLKGMPHAAPLRLPPTIHTTAASGGQPTAAGLPLAHLSLLHNFDGINSTQNLEASTVGLEPPDEGLGVGNGYVVNIVNLAIAVYSEKGVILAGPVSATTFFGEPVAFTGGTLTSDPRVYFDAATNTWFATIFEFDNGSVSGTPSSHVDIAVNPTGNPLSTWTIYRFDTTDANDNGCPCFPDFPQFGIDQFNVYISTNEFSIAGTQFDGAQLYAISKSQLEALASSVNLVHFGNLSIGGAITYHLQPAIAYTNAPAEYFVNSLDPNGTFDHRLGVWAMRNRPSVTTGVGMPILSSALINSETYGFPVNAVTPPGFNGFTGEPTTGIVTADFDAVQEVEYINGHLDTALDTAITIPGDTATRDGVAWFQIVPILSGEVISPATFIFRQGYVASQGNYLLYPHINENASGTMAMAFTLGGPGTYLSAAYTIKSALAPQFSAVNLAAAGSEPDNGFTGTAAFGGVGRWGDYSNGEVDTSGNIWLATEYIPSNGDQVANWGNRIFEITA